MVASRAPSPRVCTRRDTFSTTTIASSTTRPIASTSPNSESVLIEKPSTRISANVPISETGTVIGRDQRGAEALQEDEDDEEHEQHRLDQRGSHYLSIDSVTKRVGS